MKRQSNKDVVEGWGVIWTDHKGKEHYYGRPRKTKKLATEYRDFKCGKNGHKRGYKVVKMKKTVTTTFTWEQTK